MRTARVIVLPYDAKWKSDFENIKSETEAAICDVIIGIEHIGSASVEGRSANGAYHLSVKGRMGKWKRKTIKL